MNDNTRASHIWEKPPRDQYAKNILHKKFYIVHPIQLMAKDRILDLQCPHIGYEKVKTIDKIAKIGDFYEISFIGESNKQPPKYAHTCLFGKLIED